MKTSEIKLGQKIKDMVTGQLKWMNGCHQLGLKPSKLSKEGEPLDTFYIDIEQLEVMPGGIVNKLKKVKLSGGNKSSIDLPKR